MYPAIYLDLMIMNHGLLKDTGTWCCINHPMRRCGSFLMTPGWSYVSFGAVACHARNQLWWSNVLRQGNLRIPPIWGSFQREKSFCNLSKHERLFMDCEPAPMVCHDWWSQAWPCLSCFFARSNASTTWFSDVVCHGESSTGQSNPSVTPNDWQWETPKIESFCPKKGDWEESWIYDACKVSTQFWFWNTIKKPCEARRATGETSTWKGSDVLDERFQEGEHVDDQP